MRSLIAKLKRACDRYMRGQLRKNEILSQVTLEDVRRRQRAAARKLGISEDAINRMVSIGEDAQQRIREEDESA